jgi:uncharacterized protein YodC (DUF2158 family)
MEFKAGDVVTLKSSKLHKMTVNVVGTMTGEVECVWWEGNELKRASLYPAALEHYVEREPQRKTIPRGSAWSA